MTATSRKRPDELRAEFVAAAQEALEEALQSGEGFDAGEVHEYLRVKMSGKSAARPRSMPWRA